MTERTHRPRPRTYEKHSPYVWEAVRRDYLHGWTVAQCAERHGVGTAITAWRVREHRWREDRDLLEAIRHGAAPPPDRDPLAPIYVTSAPTPAGAPPPAQPPSLLSPAYPPPPPSQPAPADAPDSPEAAARQAFERAARALAEGRPAEAQTWARLAKGLESLSLPGDGDGEASAEPEQQRFTPFRMTAFDTLNTIAERRLDQLLSHRWHARVDDRDGLPEWGIDRDGRVVLIRMEPDAWLDLAGGVALTREQLGAHPGPFGCDFIVPPLAWLMEVWLPDWNQRHPDTPCTAHDALHIHEIYTDSPRLRREYDGEQVDDARAAWLTERAALEPGGETALQVAEHEQARAEDARRRQLRAERIARWEQLQRERDED